MTSVPSAPRKHYAHVLAHARVTFLLVGETSPQASPQETQRECEAWSLPSPPAGAGMNHTRRKALGAPVLGGFPFLSCGPEIPVSGGRE